MRNSRQIQGVVTVLLMLLCSLAHAEWYRFFTGPYPGLATNPSLCTDETQPWY